MFSAILSIPDSRWMEFDCHLTEKQMLGPAPCPQFHPSLAWSNLHAIPKPSSRFPLPLGPLTLQTRLQP